MQSHFICDGQARKSNTRHEIRGFEGFAPMNELQTFLNAAKVMTRYGVGHMWIVRRLKDSDFPKPTYLGRNRFWKLADLEGWERAQAANAKPSKVA
jgi:predicted DNA-binding transcriptional regulator AlpA